MSEKKVLVLIALGLVTLGLLALPPARVRRQCRAQAEAVVATHPGEWVVVEAAAQRGGYRAVILAAADGFRFAGSVGSAERPDIAVLVTGDRVRLEFSSRLLAGGMVIVPQPMDWLRVERK